MNQQILLAVVLSTLAILSLLLFLTSCLLSWYHSTFQSSGTILKIQNRLVICSLVSIWFSISMGFTMYNKLFMRVWWQGEFDFPIINTSLHMIIKFLITRIWYFFNEGDWRDKDNRPISSESPECHSIEPTISSEENNSTSIHSMDASARSTSIHLLTQSLSLFFTSNTALMLGIGVTTAADVALSNESVIHLSVSLYTTIKASSLIFTYFWTCLLGIEVLRKDLLAAILSMSLGIMLAVFGVSGFSFVGFIACLLAAALGGLRWALLQILIRRESLKYKDQSPVLYILYQFAPYTLLIIPLAMWCEGYSFWAERSYFLANLDICFQALIISSTGGALAFALIYIEMALVKITSSLTMAVLGQLKEMLQICLAVLVFSDKVNIRAILGLTVSSCAAYYYKILQVEAELEQHQSGNSVTYHLQSQDEDAFSIDDGYKEATNSQLHISCSSRAIYPEIFMSDSHSSRGEDNEMDVLLPPKYEDELEMTTLKANSAI